MSNLTYLLYIHLFTLFIGAMALYLGYGLLALDSINAGKDDADNIIANASNGKIAVKNFVAGIFFSCFGAFLIMFTLFSESPQTGIEQAAQKLHRQAGKLHRNGNLKAAYEIEQITASLQAQKDLYLKTAAKYAFESKDCYNAVAYMQQAIALQEGNSDYQATLQRYQKDCR